MIVDVGLPFRRAAVAGLLLTGCLTLAAEESFSRSNTLLFLSDHFRLISQPSTLIYEFVREGSDNEDFSDTIDIKVVEIREEDGKNLDVNYFSGERQRYVPPIQGARGNPALILFLQRDVNEMGRRNQTPSRRYQDSIKIALEESAEVNAVTFEFEGKDVAGTEITIRPFANNPGSDDFPQYSAKQYAFVLSDAVPGTVYQIRSLLPANGDRQAQRETLTFRELSSL